MSIILIFASNLNNQLKSNTIVAKKHKEETAPEEVQPEEETPDTDFPNDDEPLTEVEPDADNADTDPEGI